MKIKYFFILLPLLLAACGNTSESPKIAVEKLYLNGDRDHNLAGSKDEMPALSVNDELEIALSLDGMGAELKTFKLEKDDELETELSYRQNVVTSEGNLTDEKKGRLRFADGVMHTLILVNAVVKEVEDDNTVRLCFYLSSKAECESAQQELYLQLKSVD